MRKLSLAVGAALLVVGPVSAQPAQAQEGTAYVTWQSPQEGARLSGRAVHIKAKVGVYGGVKSWAVEALAPEDADYPGYGTVCEGTESRAPAFVNIDCVWDTTAYPNDGGQALNRPYVVRITSHGNSPNPHAEDRNVIVANPVSAPRDVKLGFVEATRQATVRWQQNPEPDVVSYAVQERVGDGPWKNVGQAGGRATTFTRTLPAPGTYRYQVAALRSAGSGDDTVQSAWSGPANEPKQIVVAEPPRPETTTTTTPSAGDSPEPPPPADPGDPTVPPAPPQVTSAGAPNDPAAPGPPAPEGSTDTSRSGAALVSPIQHGAPGSVRSGGATVGGLAAPPSTKPPKEPQEGEEPEGPDTGFSSELPYKQHGESAEEGDGGVGRVLVGLPEAIGGDETRQVLVPLAGGLLLFVFAMHVLYISRRAAPEAPLDTE